MSAVVSDTTPLHYLILVGREFILQSKIIRNMTAASCDLVSLVSAKELASSKHDQQ